MGMTIFVGAVEVDANDGTPKPGRFSFRRQSNPPGWTRTRPLGASGGDESWGHDALGVFRHGEVLVFSIWIIVVDVTGGVVLTFSARQSKG